MPEQIRHALRGQPTLLVLDNLEHLTGGGTVGRRIVAPARTLSVLATCRSPLRLGGGESARWPRWRYPIRRELPPRPGQEALAPLCSTGWPRTGLSVDAANAAGRLRDLRRVDGLPLAIELAAARIKVLSPALLARLTGWSCCRWAQDQDHRLQSMRAAIAWSYDLLDPDGRRCSAAWPPSPTHSVWTRPRRC